jgi:hypothetical protein
MKQTEKTIEEVVKEYKLLEINSQFSDAKTWYRKDRMFNILTPIVKNLKIINEYGIFPTYEARDLIDHINFTELHFESFEEAAKAMNQLTLPKLN